MTYRLKCIYGLVIEMHDTFLSDPTGFDRWLNKYKMYFANADYWADSFIDFYVLTYSGFCEKNWKKYGGGSYYDIFDPFFGCATCLAIPASIVENVGEFETCTLEMQKDIKKRNKGYCIRKFLFPRKDGKYGRLVESTNITW